MVGMHLLCTSAAGVGFRRQLAAGSLDTTLRAGPGISGKLAVPSLAATTTDPA